MSLLTGLPGRSRRKGSDLADGSDVKAANVWDAIDTPRFNGCAPAGRTTSASRKPNDVSALDDIPFLFFVLWDERTSPTVPRCRVWCVKPNVDVEFRKLVSKWYDMRQSGEIKSANFQLHPPRNEDHNIIGNSLGRLEYRFSSMPNATAGNTVSCSSTRLCSGRVVAYRLNREAGVI